MKFELLIEPSYSRKPFHLGGGADYSFQCKDCGSQILLESGEIFMSMEPKFSDQKIKEIREFFMIGYVGKSRDGGWPSISEVKCSGCELTYICYIGVHEVANGYYKLTEQGLAVILR